MGLSMHLNLFHQVTPDEVYTALGNFYRQRGQALVERGNLIFGCVLHEQDRGWTLAQPEDTCRPFDECAVLDFPWYFGVNVELEYHWVTLANVELWMGGVTFAAPVWCEFWVSGQNTKELWKEKRRQSRQGGAST